MSRCAHCQAPIDREHAFHRIERGAVIDTTTIAADLDYCTLTCLAARWAKTIERTA